MLDCCALASGQRCADPSRLRHWQQVFEFERRRCAVTVVEEPYLVAERGPHWPSHGGAAPSAHGYAACWPADRSDGIALYC
jgi:hypothetical protein